MKANELYPILNSVISTSLSCQWDNDGIMCMSEPNREVKKVLLTLDITYESVKYAADNGFDTVISHHPIIYHPLKGINDIRFTALIKNDINAFSFHTRLDKHENGVNTALAEILGLKNLRKFGYEEMAVMGELESPMTDSDFAVMAKRKLKSSHCEGILSGRICKKVAVLGGSGDDLIKEAKENGADLYLSGELGYNDMTDASLLDISVLALGHYYTENPVLDKLDKIIKEIDNNIQTEIFECNLIKTI